MSLSLLVLGGASESAEPALIQAAAHTSRRFSRIESASRLPDRKRWTVVWFHGHTTVRASAGEATLDEKVRGRYRVLLPVESLQTLSCDLLVLSSCHTDHPVVRNALGSKPALISYQGKHYFHDALLFAASFTHVLFHDLPCDARRLTPARIINAFDYAQQATGQDPCRVLRLHDTVHVSWNSPNSKS